MCVLKNKLSDKSARNQVDVSGQQTQHKLIYLFVGHFPLISSSFHISRQSPSVPVEAAEQLLTLTHSLRKTNDPTVRTSLPPTLPLFSQWPQSKCCFAVPHLTPPNPQAQSLASSLSTRQLLRICRRLSKHPEESVARSVNKACLSRSTSKSEMHDAASFP